MLEQLFGSKTRVRLLRLFLSDHRRVYYVRELTRRIGAQINAVRNELDNLVDSGLLVVCEDERGTPATGKRRRQSRQKKFYRLNTDSLIYPELKALFLKARVLLEKDLVRRLIEAGSIQYLALMGQFVDEDAAPTDLFVIGRVSRERLMPLVREHEREIGKELNYTVMTPQEFKYRRQVTDRFLYGLLEAKKIVVLDNLAEKAPGSEPV